MYSSYLYPIRHPNLPMNYNSFDSRIMPQQPAPHPFGNVPMNHTSPYQQQNHYSSSHLGYGGYNNYQSMYGHKQDISQLLFENPLQTQNEMPYSSYYQSDLPYPNMNPYPQQNFLPKQPGGFQSVMNSFKNQDGNLDLNKMVDTAGQMMNAVTQVSSMVKGLGGILKA